MAHAVSYRDASGQVTLRDVPSLEAGVELVERLRNEEGAAEVRLFREVPLEVRTYYKVVALDADGPVAPPPGAMPLTPAPGGTATTTVATPPVPPAATGPADEDAEEPVSADGRRGLFGRG